MFVFIGYNYIEMIMFLVSRPIYSRRCLVCTLSYLFIINICSLCARSHSFPSEVSWLMSDMVRRVCHVTVKARPNRSIQRWPSTVPDTVLWKEDLPCGRRICCVLVNASPMRSFLSCNIITGSCGRAKLIWGAVRRDCIFLQFSFMSDELLFRK